MQCGDLKSAKGFTLIELLVVIVIVSIMIGVTVISVNPNTRKDRLLRETNLLYELMRLAAEESVLQAREYGIRFSRHGYAFYELNGKDWVPVDGDKRMREREIPQEFVPEVEIDGVLIVLDETLEKPKPQVMMLSSGEIIPDFSITLRDEDAEFRYRIEPGEETELDLVNPDVL